MVMVNLPEWKQEYQVQVSYDSGATWKSYDGDSTFDRDEAFDVLDKAESQFANQQAAGIKVKSKGDLDRAAKALETWANTRLRIAKRDVTEWQFG